ncbi:efflux RND transporter periplasmic adaptor subunit [Aquifex sp.]
MMVVLLLLLVLITFGGEGHEHGEHHGEIILSEEQIRTLGIKLYTLKKQEAKAFLKLPAEVNENLTEIYKVYSPVEGIVRKLYVKEGDRVRKGEPLVEVFSPEIASLVAQVKIAKARMESSKKLLGKYEKLFKDRFVKSTEYYRVLSEYLTSKGEYEALTNQLRSLGEVRNNNLILRTSLTGIVTLQGVSPGESVGPDTEIFEIHTHRNLWVYGWLEEEKRKLVKEGMKGVVLTKDGDKEECTVDFVSHKIDRKTRKLKVRCVAPNEKHTLLPGMFVTLLIGVEKGEAFIVPKSAVQEIEGKYYIFVRTEKGFEPKEVRILDSLDGYYVIEGEIHEGERVAITGTIFLKTKLVGVEEGGHAH